MRRAGARGLPGAGRHAGLSPPLPRAARRSLAPAARPRVALAILAALVVACAPASPPRGIAVAPGDRLTAAETAFLDTLQRRTFRWFWEQTDSARGLTPDRWPTRSFCSVGAVGFGLTAYPIGAERGWVTRAAAAQRALRTLEFFAAAPMGPAPAGVTGYKGFFYHFLDPATGLRWETVELSTVDTALLLAGALFCQSYFDRDDPAEVRVRALAETLATRADWRWASVRPPTIALGWNPESGHLPYDWRGYNEAMILVLLALGSPTHPVADGAWEAWTANYRWGAFHGEEHVGFGPLFGHQYSHVWVDFRGIRDAAMRERGLDYFENSRRATLAQRAYALANPGGFRGYGARLWGLTACDGPVDREVTLDGRVRRFRTYAARGASHTGIEDDGTVAPTAAIASLPFAPREVMDVTLAMRADWGEHAFGPYGFVDALNPTLDRPLPVQHGRVVAGVGWFDTDVLGIDQGPILAMIENHRSGLVWRTMRRNPHLVRGLRRAGFTGGWLDAAPAAR